MVPDPSAEQDCPVSAAAIGAARIATAAAAVPNSGVMYLSLMRTVFSLQEWSPSGKYNDGL
jgi:hypothetical protein